MEQREVGQKQACCVAGLFKLCYLCEPSGIIPTALGSNLHFTERETETPGSQSPLATGLELASGRVEFVGLASTIWTGGWVHWSFPLF